MSEHFLDLPPQPALYEIVGDVGGPFAGAIITTQSLEYQFNTPEALAAWTGPAIGPDWKPAALLGAALLCLIWLHR